MPSTLQHSVVPMGRNRMKFKVFESLWTSSGLVYSKEHSFRNVALAMKFAKERIRTRDRTRGVWRIEVRRHDKVLRKWEYSLEES